MARRHSILAAALAVLVLIAAGAIAAAPQTERFSSGTVVRKVPDPGTVVQKVTVSRRGEIRDVNAEVRISHSRDSDVTIMLQHPFGRTILLAGSVGGIGGDFGAGAEDCTGTTTQFSDEAPDPITTGTAPFAGVFKPQQPLSRFDGKQMQGEWRLLVTDHNGPGSQGIVRCAKVRIRFQPN